MTFSRNGIERAVLLLGVALLFAVPQAGAQEKVAPAAAEPGAATSETAGDAASANGAERVAAVVEQGFPLYDADGSGDLDKGEFSKWVLELKAEEMKATGATMPPEEQAAWAAASFTMADTDGDARVGKAELVHYLGG